jgi:hypothetical protein
VLLSLLLSSACMGGSSSAGHGQQQVSSPPAAAAELTRQDEQTIQAEEQKQGDTSWGVNAWAKPDVLAGFSTPASALPGEPLMLHIRGVDPKVTVGVFRMGYYGGTGARKVFQTDLTVRPPSRPVVVRASTRTVGADWSEGLALKTSGWTEGDYLARLSASGKQTWVPFTLRSRSFKGKLVLLSANTTWQAYNAWGGRSLYHGVDGATATRAYAVSFDRPYDYGNGAADFGGNERPLVQLAEQLGLPVAYAVSTDLQTSPGLLDGARGVISLGHDEYWSTAMRAQLSSARDGGTNLAFLGANAIYRHIRLENLPSGKNRLEIDYKTGRLDPITAKNPSEATWDWPAGPKPRDGDALTGGHYTCNPVQADLLLRRDAPWPLNDLATRLTRLPGLVGSEYDKLVSDRTHPANTISLARSPVTCRGTNDHADVTYYTTPSGAAGFDVGTSTWICVLTDGCGAIKTSPQVRAVVLTVTTRVLRAFAAGPAGRSHPVR